MTSALQASYDEFPYQSLPFAQSHPDRLATLGWLFGMSPTPIDRCKLLEIGCSAGGNVIPLAATLRRSEFTGIDFSRVQIADGAAQIAALGLANVRLLEMDLRAVGESFGSFDYIVAHGVLSWVPEDVQEKLFAVCKAHLAPNGIAYISYNTLPGWSTRSAIRDAMQYHTRRFTGPKTRVLQARALLDFFAESLQNDASAYGAMLRDEALRLRQQPDFYIFHEHLEDVNLPMYFHEFMTRATRHGLRYLAEADFRTMLTHDLAPAVAQTLAHLAPDLLQREQMLDFLRNQAFRQTLLVHEAAPLNRRLSPERLFSLFIATRATPVSAMPDIASAGTEEFRTPEGAMLTAHRSATKAAMVVLAERSPMACAFDELCALAQARLGGQGSLSREDRDALASDLLQCYAAGVVELQSAASPFVIDPGARPEAGRVARWQAPRNAQVTNLRHEFLTLDEAARRLLVLLDGTRTQNELAALASPDVEPGAASIGLQSTLGRLARQALLVR
ncbi:MAG: methyltransferase regulatory domain-containing protein [Casimicrobiaceae bacterium]